MIFPVPAIRKRRLAAVLAAATLLASAAVFVTGSFIQPAPVSAQPVADHLANAQALYDQGRYAEALPEVNAALAANPDSFQAKTLKAGIEAKLMAPPTTAPATGETATAPATQKKEVLTPAQINHIKVLEMTDGEIDKATGSADRKDLEDLWKHYVTHDSTVSSNVDAKNDFLKPTNLPAQLHIIRDNLSYSTMDKLRINGDPAFISTFATKVQPYIVQNCATSACHGGKNLMIVPLFNTPGHTGTPQTYTNFYVLSMSRSSDGGKLIDRDNPDLSLIVQYLIQPENARFHHPKMAPLRRSFKDITDPNIVAIMAWIKTLQIPMPNYAINYPLPAPKPRVAATQPAK